MNDLAVIRRAFVVNQPKENEWLGDEMTDERGYTKEERLTWSAFARVAFIWLAIIIIIFFNLMSFYFGFDFSLKMFLFNTGFALFWLWLLIKLRF